MPVLDVAATLADDGTLAVFFVNRSQEAAAEVTIDLANVRAVSIGSVEILTGATPKTANTWENPNAVVPTEGSASIDEDGKITVTVPKLAFVALTATVTPR